LFFYYGLNRVFCLFIHTKIIQKQAIMEFRWNVKDIKCIHKTEGRNRHSTSRKKLCICGVNYIKIVKSFSYFDSTLYFSQMSDLMLTHLK
jgi:hypothetical protein